MKPTPARSESRRLEAERERSEYRADLWQKTVRWMKPGVLMIWVMFYVLALVVLLAGSESMPWRQDQRVDQDIIARVPFEADDPLQTDQDRQRARDTAPMVFVLNDKALESAVAAVRDGLRLPAGATVPPKTRAETGAGPALSPADQSAVRQFEQKEKDPAAALDRIVEPLKDRLAHEYLVDVPADALRRNGAMPPITVLRRQGHPDQKVLSEQLLPRDAASVKAAAEQVAQAVAPRPLAHAVADLLQQALTPSPGNPARAGPLWRIDQQATAREIDAAVAAVPPVKLHYTAKDQLVPAGKVLTGYDLMLLRQEHNAFLQAQKTAPALRHKTQLMSLGMAGIVLLVTLGLATYTVVYQNRQFQPARTAALAGLLLVMTLLSRLNERAQYPWDLPVEFSVGFVVVAAALLAIAYDQRVALGAAGGLAVLMTLASRADLTLYLTLAMASAVTIFSLKEVRTRSKIVAVGALSAVGAFVASASGGLIFGQEPRYVLVHAIAAGAAAVAAGFIVQGILPNFERLFGVATSMTLLEWSDANKPLLRRLAQEAPGTYSHSLMLSQVAEEAAEAIGARGLLARVGALYHDIGKIQKPEYFVENQEARMNRHERLSPTMSLLIIVGHVKDGVEMARAYGVPKILHQFIAEHHGTTVVRYFHHVASEAAARHKGRHSRESAESEFRYPGPKPRSREAAILMLCDGCEGAVRSLAEPIPGRIESTVHQVVMDRLNDGQFDECDITLRELKIVEQSLVKSLAAIHHGRIKYPKAAPAEKARPATEGVQPTETPVRPSPAPEVARQA